MRSHRLSLTTLSLSAALLGAMFAGCATQQDSETPLGDGEVNGGSAGVGGSGGAGNGGAAGTASSGGAMTQAGTTGASGAAAGMGGGAASTAGSGGSAANIAGSAGSNGSSAGSAGTASGGTSSAGAGGMTTAGTGTVEPDTTPPSAPSSLQATAITASSVTVTWNASTDNVGVAGYRLFNGNTEVTTTTGTIHTFKGLNASTAYTFGVEAYDAEDNTSTRAKKSATTSAAPACDAGSAVATLTHGQSYAVSSTACIQLSVNPNWDPVEVLLEQTDGGSISYTFNSCAGNGSGTISSVLTLYEGSNPGCNFFVRLSGSGSVTYYD